MGLAVAGCGSDPQWRQSAHETSSHAEDEAVPSDLSIGARFVEEPAARGVAALGSIEELSPRLRRVLDPSAFEPLPPPREGSWRGLVREPSQSFSEFVGSRPNVPDQFRDTLVLLPLGSFPTELLVERDHVVLVQSPRLEVMRELAVRFFGLPVDVVTPLPIEQFELPLREHGGHDQYDALGVLDGVEAVLPDHAYSMTVLINHDLFVTEDQDHGFGYATHEERLAVMSFARFEPQFSGEWRAPDERERIPRRGLKVLVHEIAHTFGLRHCDYYACIMNGMADREEVDATPLHLCPVCLRKLMSSVGFDPVVRYEQLEALYAELEMEEERAWVHQRVAEITAE